MLDRIRLPWQLNKPISRRAGLVLISGTVGVVGFSRLVGPGLLDFDGYWPQRARLKASAAWTETSLSVREGSCYRISVAGSCKDSSGETFGPEGTAPAELRSPLGPSGDLAAAQRKEAFVGDLPRRMLLAKVRDFRILLPVGDGLTFVAPSSGDLSFRVNNETEATGAFTGDLRVTLERVHRPGFVDADGKTMISTRVSKTKYLLFEPEGVRWQFSSFQSALEEPEYPTLLNGIAWWPLPDKPNTEGWRQFTLSSRTPLLKTRAFSWAADPNGKTPVVDDAEKSTKGRLVTVESTTSSERRLTFSAADQAGGVVSCTLSRP